MVSNLCIANARYFGGGMKIAPDAKLTDGKFDVVGVGDLECDENFHKRAASLPRFAPLDAGSESRFGTQGNGSITGSRPEVALEIDGELPGRLPATFQIVPKRFASVVSEHHELRYESRHYAAPLSFTPGFSPVFAG